MATTDRAVRHVERVEAEVADPGVHEIDHVAIADPVDEIADRAAEQQPQGDRQDHARLRPGVVRDDQADHREGRDRQHDGGALEEAEQPAVVPAVDESQPVADDLDRAAGRHVGDEPCLRQLVDDHDRDGDAEEQSPAGGPTFDGRASDGHHRS